MALSPEERHAINDLFARLQAHVLEEKDAEAEALISQLMRRTPDSAYLLVQSVLVQEAQIEALEARVQELEARSADTGRASSGGSFLGGVRRSSEGRGAVPPIGSRNPSPSAVHQDRYEPATRGASWSQSARGPAGPAGARPGPGAPQAQSGGGGFFRTAAAMAAGVAGGSLLANSLGGLFGGEKSGEAQAGSNSGTATDTSSHQTSTDNDPGNYEPDYHHDAGVEEGDWGADDFDDLDI